MSHRRHQHRPAKNKTSRSWKRLLMCHRGLSPTCLSYFSAEFGFRCGGMRGGVGVASWRRQTVGKFTATSRVVKGKIDKTDTRRAECGLGTAIQAHCSDHVPATLMALTASRAEDEDGHSRGWVPPLSSSCLTGHMIIRWNVSRIKTCMCIQIGFLAAPSASHS